MGIRKPTTPALNGDFKYMEFKRNNVRLGAVVTKRGFYFVLADFARMMESKTSTLSQRVADGHRFHVKEVKSNHFGIRNNINVVTLDGVLDIFAKGRPTLSKDEATKLFDWFSTRVVPATERAQMKLTGKTVKAKKTITKSKVASVRVKAVATPKRPGYLRNLFNALIGLRFG